MVTFIAYKPDLLSELMEHEFVEAAVEQHEIIETDVESEQDLLVARALHGDTDAFTAIFDIYSGLMRRTAYSIVKDHDLAEDAVQNAIIQAWQHLPSLREASALRSWLMRIVVNQSISFKRRLARSTVFLRQAFAEQETNFASQLADDAKGSMEGNWDLAQAIRNLPAKQQMTITLHYYQGMTLPEMSQMLGISENTLKKRIQAALANLRCLMKDADRDEVMSLSLPYPQSPGGW
ncbi:MAG TPA: RNA polymerase sigma factor [Ktedonobacteraceae bacterium]|nr:RNA polymerase sigma factor [Ktedonobacteraceae bacterium]